MDITHLHLHTPNRAASEASCREWFGLATKTRDEPAITSFRCTDPNGRSIDIHCVAD